MRLPVRIRTARFHVEVWSGTQRLYASPRDQEEGRRDPSPPLFCNESAVRQDA
jgi:hypothetical protein